MKTSTFLYYGGKVLFTIMYRVLFRLRIEGEDNIPLASGAIIAPNHSSYFDPPLVGVSLPRPLYFMAKAELFKYPVFEFILRRVNAFPVRRDLRDISAIKEALSLLKSRRLLLVFPEGRRAKDNGIGEPEKGIGYLVKKSNAPVIPALLVNTYKIKKRLLPELTVRFGRPIIFKNMKSRQSPDKEFYLEVGKKILNEIKGLDREGQYQMGFR